MWKCIDEKKYWWKVSWWETFCWDKYWWDSMGRSLDEKSSDDLLSVTLTANREIKSIIIDDSLLEDKEQLEDYLILTLNKAIEKATNVNEAEIAAVAKDGMPNIPGMDMFK